MKSEPSKFDSGSLVERLSFSGIFEFLRHHFAGEALSRLYQ